MTTRFHFRTLTVRTALPLFCLIFAAPPPAQQLPWSQPAANSTIQRWPAGRFVAPGAPWKWNYELGVLLNGMKRARLSLSSIPGSTTNTRITAKFFPRSRISPQDRNLHYGLSIRRDVARALRPGSSKTTNNQGEYANT